jgi:hypothetical protein
VKSIDEAHNVIIREYDRTGNKALGYMSVCKDCKDVYIEENIIFENEPQAYAWLLRGK